MRPASVEPPPSAGLEQAKLYHALGVDLLGSLPEAAHGFMQRALRSAPKREADLIAEIMGSLCVTLNQLRRHALWKATTQRLGQCALQL